jgi:hypothetical protein
MTSLSFILVHYQCYVQGRQKAQLEAKGFSPEPKLLASQLGVIKDDVMDDQPEEPL